MKLKHIVSLKIISNINIIMFSKIRNSLKYTELPIILIDVSGSTDDEFKDGQNVMDYEFKLAHKICKDMKYDRAHIICWSDEAKLFESVKISDFDDIKQNIPPKSGTRIICGLDYLKPEFYEENKITDLIIITDGEIQDKTLKLKDKFNNIDLNRSHISIYAVEPNDHDYDKNNINKINAGNLLYRIFNDNNMMRIVRRFITYNRKEVEFVNVYNPICREGFLPYGDMMFPENKISNFVTFLVGEIKNIDTENEHIKIVQKLTHTIYNIVKNKTYIQQMETVEFFSNIFKETQYYEEVRKLLLRELDNLMIGKVSTFMDMKKDYYSAIENSKIDLIKNTSIALQSSNIHKYSHIIRQNDELYILRTLDELHDLNYGFNTYPKSSLKCDKYMVPILFEPQVGHVASQWIKTIYSKILNLKTTNDYMYLYILSDAFIARNSSIALIYNKYAESVLNDNKYGTENTLLKYITTENKVEIPIPILNNVSKYINKNVEPLTLKYLLCKIFISQHLKSNFMEKLENECKQALITDLEKNKAEFKSFDQAQNLLEEHFFNDQIKLSNIGTKRRLKSHKFLSTNIDCCGVCPIVENDKTKCGICDQYIDVIDVDISDMKITNLQFDTTKHVHLGKLDGKLDDQIFSPSEFMEDYDSISVENTMFIDPLNTVKLKIKNSEEFMENVYNQYPFLKEINMDNIALCGGFVRAILLGTVMKDFDFFFYGLKTNEEYITKLKEIIMEINKAVLKIYPNVKFGLFYKPQYNVYEMICYEDPTNFITEDFDLTNFQHYKFNSLKRYYSKNDKSDINDNNKYYFEDNDDHGIKMKYRFQMIMCKYDSISDIFKSFDMFPAMVAFDGKQVYFTKKSLIAYRYMINEVNLSGGSDVFRHRLNKYFKYGFNIVLPYDNRSWTEYKTVKQSNNENEGPLCFKVHMIRSNLIYINHNSNIESLMAKNNILEKKLKDDGKMLYKSYMFCSFVSILRYISINKMDYSFPGMIFEDEIFDKFEAVFKDNRVAIKFLEKFDTKFRDVIWYENFCESICLSD